MSSPTLPIAATLATLLLLASAAQGSMPTRYECNGNEPFWGLAIDGEHAGWATPEEPEGRRLEGTYQRLDYAGLFAWRGPFGEADLVAIVTDQSCSDTMADRDYPFRVTVSLPDGSVVLGCCDTSSMRSVESRTQPNTGGLDEPSGEGHDESLADLPVAVLEEKPPGDWSRLLFDLLPAIGACIDKTPGSSPRVVKAWPMNHGRVGVRTSNREDAVFECVANHQGTKVDSFTALRGETVAPHGGWSPIFTPPEQRPPTGECYQHERVVGASGELVGWLSYDTC